MKEGSIPAMSEKEPNREKKKKGEFKDDCMNCESVFGLNVDNTFAITYEKDWSCNHLVVNCPDCNHLYRVFCNSQTLDRAADEGIMFNPKVRRIDPNTGEVLSIERTGGKFAPDDIWALRYQLDGVEMVQPVEISPRHEKIIEAFGKTITEMTIKDPDGFWQDINSPQDRPYTQRWC